MSQPTHHRVFRIGCWSTTGGDADGFVEVARIDNTAGFFSVEDLDQIIPGLVQRICHQGKGIRSDVDVHPDDFVTA